MHGELEISKFYFVDPPYSRKIQRIGWSYLGPEPSSQSFFEASVAQVLIKCLGMISISILVLVVSIFNPGSLLCMLCLLH